MMKISTFLSGLKHEPLNQIKAQYTQLPISQIYIQFYWCSICFNGRLDVVDWY